MPSVTYEIGEHEYEVTATGFVPPTPATRDEPGDGGEVYPSPVVQVLKDGKYVSTVTLETLLLLLALEHGQTITVVTRQLEDKLHEACLEHYCDSFDEGPDQDDDF